jgi:hypothetical protein
MDGMLSVVIPATALYTLVRIVEATLLSSELSGTRAITENQYKIFRNLARLFKTFRLRIKFQFGTLSIKLSRTAQYQ